MRATLFNCGIMPLLIALLVLTGCAVKPVARIPFPEHEYAALARSGTAVVRGQAFLKTRGGDVKTAAGETVGITPVTSYSSQWYLECYLNGVPLTPPDPRYENFVRHTVADADGRFVFTNLPPGRYYVASQVLWEAQIGYHRGLVVQGGLVASEVTVRDGEQLDVILTR